MSAPRLLLVTDEMEIGGTQRQIVTLARALAGRLLAPEVVYFRERSALVDELEAAAVPVWCVPKRARIDPLFALRLARLFRARRAALVHCFSFSGELWGALATRLTPRARLVTSIRGTYEWYSRAQWRVKRWTARRSFAVVANSRAGAAYAEQKLAMAAGSIEVVYNGVQFRPVQPATRRDEARRALGLDGDTVLAVFAGRLVDHKNVDSLLDAFARVPRSGPQLRLLVAGDGPLRAQLEARVVELGLSDRVRLLGMRNDVRDLVLAGDFLVLPSLREGLSNVLLEAMAEARAVIASRVGGNVEIVEDGCTGLLYPSDDRAALAAAIHRLAADPLLRERLGCAGRRRAEELFSVETMVDRMERLYRNGLANQPLVTAGGDAPQ